MAKQRSRGYLRALQRCCRYRSARWELPRSVSSMARAVPYHAVHRTRRVPCASAMMPQQPPPRIAAGAFLAAAAAGAARVRSGQRSEQNGGSTLALAVDAAMEMTVAACPVHGDTSPPAPKAPPAWEGRPRLGLADVPHVTPKAPALGAEFFLQRRRSFRLKPRGAAGSLRALVSNERRLCRRVILTLSVPPTTGGCPPSVRGILADSQCG